MGENWERERRRGGGSTDAWGKIKVRWRWAGAKPSGRKRDRKVWHSARQGGWREGKTGHKLEGEKVRWGSKAWKEAGKLGEEEEGGRQAGRPELSVRGEDDHIPRHSGAT